MDSQKDTFKYEEFAGNLDSIFDQVDAQGEEITVERRGKLFVLRPKRRHSARKSHRMTREDPLWEIVGIAASGEPGNTVASNKYTYVADAIASHFEPPHEQQEHAQVTQASQDAEEVPPQTPPMSSGQP